MLIGVGQQREEARALDGHRELALVEGLRAGDAARNDLACLGDVALERGEILVVDLLDAFGGEASKLLAA